METRITAGLIDNDGKLETFLISVTDKNFRVVRKKIEFEIEKVRQIFRDMFKDGKIKSLSKPRNEKTQDKIDKLAEFKEELKASIDKIKELYTR